MTHALNSVRTFAFIHDDLPAFHASFLVLTLLAAFLFNLGAFALLIGLHMTLDVWKYRSRLGLGWGATFAGVVRESLLDVTLLAVGLVFSVYLHQHIGLVSVNALLRPEAGFIRAVAVLVPKVKIMHRLAGYLERTHPHHQRGWSQLDKFCLAIMAFCVALLFGAATLMQVEPEVVKKALLEEVVPWRV